MKLRFNASKEKFESYGGNKYLVYLPFAEDEDSESIVAGLLSRKLGVPSGRIYFKGKDFNGDWVFQLT